MTEYSVTERRPMGPRQWPVMVRIADAVAKTPITPNTISVASVFFGALAGAAFLMTSETSGISQRLLWLAGALAIQVRGLCNLFDGMVAVQKNTASAVGELYNEAPDRISDVAMLVGLGYAWGSSPVLGYWAAIVAVWVAYTRALVKSAGAPQDFCGPMAKPVRMQLVSLTALLHVILPTVWIHRLWGPEHAWGLTHAVLWIVVIGGVITSVRRLRRGAHAMRIGI